MVIERRRRDGYIGVVGSIIFGRGLHAVLGHGLLFALATGHERSAAGVWIEDRLFRLPCRRALAVVIEFERLYLEMSALEDVMPELARGFDSIAPDILHFALGEQVRPS